MDSETRECKVWRLVDEILSTGSPHKMSVSKENAPNCCWKLLSICTKVPQYVYNYGFWKEGKGGLPFFGFEYDVLNKFEIHIRSWNKSQSRDKQHRFRLKTFWGKIRKRQSYRGTHILFCGRGGIYRYCTQQRPEGGARYGREGVPKIGRIMTL